MIFDQILFDFIHGFAGRSWIVDGLGIFFASPFAYVLVLLAVYLFFIVEKEWRQRIYLFSFAALSMLLAKGIVVETIQFFFSRPRPFAALDFIPLIEHSASAGFPSSHATIFFALAFVIFFYNRRWGWWFLAGALFIGIARIFVGVHWPLDILGGIAVALVSVLLIHKLLPDMKKPATSVVQD